jgi:glutamyl-tRNA reductase
VSRELLLVGLSHHTAPVEVRERLAFENGRLEPALRALVDWPGVAEGAIVSTCNRVEVVACGSDADRLAAELPRFLGAQHGLGDDLVRPHLYRHHGREAVRHLFRVAASLDSMVVGEPQILGQLKSQYAVAAALGTSGRVLHRCFHKSFSVAKRVRTETGIAEKAVSVGSAAVALARGIFDRFEDKTALLLGAGTMGELTARQLLAQGTGTLMVANRTYERAIEVARELGGMPVPLERVARYLPLADLVVSAAGGRSFLLDTALVREAMRERRQRSMFLIDLAVPRSIDPAVNALDGVYVYDVDDLQAVVHENRDARASEALRAEAIIDAEVEAFWQWLEGLDVVPTIVALRAHVEAIRDAELARYLAVLESLDPRQREAVERVTRAIVNKVLHAPLSALRHERNGGDGVALTEAVRLLFQLDPATIAGGVDDADDEEA